MQEVAQKTETTEAQVNSKQKTFLSNPKYRWIIAFLLGSLAMYMMLSYSQLLTTGKYVIMTGDALEIYVANIRMLIRNVLHGETIWYSFATSMGFNTSLTIAFELMSPFNIFFLIFNKVDPNVVLALIIVLKTGTAAATFQLFSKYVLKENGVFSVVFSVFYAMCAFNAVYCIANFMWLDGIYMLPVVAMAVYLAVKDGKYAFLTIAYAATFIIQFYMGYVIGIFSFLLFIAFMVLIKKEERKLSTSANIVRYVVSVASSVAIAAFLWVPVVIFLLLYNASDATGFSAINISVLDVLNNLFWGEFQDYHTNPYIYCGVPSLLLLPFYFTNKKIDKKERAGAALLALFFVIACLWLPLYKLLHGFDAPDMWNYRFSFVLSFILCVIACRQARFFKCIEIKWLVLYVGLLALLYSVVQKIQQIRIGWLTRNNNVGLLINVGLLTAWICIIVFYNEKEKSKKLFRTIMIVLALTEVISNACVRTFDPVWKQGFRNEDSFYAWDAEMEKFIGDVNSIEGGQNSEFYRVCIAGDLIHNSDAYYGYNGITDFNSGENEVLRTFLGNMGLYATTRRTGGTGFTLPLEMILSVKYSGRIYPELRGMGLEADNSIKLNENWLPLAYMVEEDCLAPIEFSDNTFENQNMVIYSMSGIDSIYSQVDMANLKIEDKGLTISKDGSVIRTPNGTGSLVVSTKSDKPFNYIQIVPFESDYSVTGIQFFQSPNMVHELDYHVDVPFIVEMLPTKGGFYSGLSVDEGYAQDFRIQKMFIYELNKDKLDEAYRELSKEVMITDRVKNGFVQGHVSVRDDKRVLFTSIPYAEGWKVTVNNTPAEIAPALNGSFIAVVLPREGEYDLTFEYTCPGQKLGVIISLFGLAGFGLLLLIERRRHNKQ